MKNIMKILLLMTFTLLPFEGQAASENVEIEIGERFFCDVNDHGNNNYPWSIVNISWEFSSGLHHSNSTSSYTNYVWVDDYVSGRLYATVKWTETKLGSSDNVWLHKSYTWYFTVTNVPVESVSLRSPIYLYADETMTINSSSQWMTISPSYATVNYTRWESSNPNVATIDNSGYLRAIWPGKTTINCLVNGSVMSNNAEVIVSEPSLTFRGFSVANQANGVETRPTIKATYSHAISRSNNFDKIALTNEQGQKVDGSVSISSNTLSFTPSKHLPPLSKFTLTIPQGAVKNKWGTDYQYEQKVSFTTADWQQMTVFATPEAKFLTPGDEISLRCSATAATIYYSKDGSAPTTRYDGPITFDGDMTIRAVAKLDGYYDSDELRREYLQCVEITEKWPDSNLPLYNYADVIPSITFSYPIEQGEAFSNITVKDRSGESVACMPLVQKSTLYFVSAEPLENGMTYTITLPKGALVVTDRGEESKAYEWTFATGNYVAAISVGGPELGAALKTDGSLWTWGRWLTAANATDGSYSCNIQSIPANFVDGDVSAVSSGYTHHAIIKTDGSLWMWGRQLCGEFGNGTTTASAKPVKVMDDVKNVSCGLQNTAVVKQDGTLWMCGRNDLGQIDDTRTVHRSFVQIADGISRVELNWGSLLIEKTDGTTETRTWDATADDGRRPAKEGINNNQITLYGWQNAVGLGYDGSVWVWNETDAPTEIMAGRNPQLLEGVSFIEPTLQLKSEAYGVIVYRPQPLLADYTIMSWKSDNTHVVQVNDRGLITAVNKGTTLVTATISDAYGHEYKAVCEVTVGKSSDISTSVFTLDSTKGDESMKVSTSNRQLFISGIPEGQTVSIYNVSGTCLWKGSMQGLQISIPVNQSGIYVVRSARQIKKVAVR